MNANAQLREEESFDPAWLMAGLDVCLAGVAVVERGRILYANNAFGKSSGVMSSAELRGRSVTDLLPRSTRYLDARDVENRLAEGRSQIEASISGFEQNRRAFQIVCVHPVPAGTGSDGAPQNAQEAGQLSAGIAHDLNNIMTGIMLYSDLLISGIEIGSRFRHHAEAIHKAGSNGSSLIQQLMSPSGQESLAIQPLSWNQAVSEMVSLLTRLSGDSIEIETKLAEPAGFVKIDSVSAQRIIVNLVLNARDAMPAGGKIILSTRNSSFSFANSENQEGRPIPCVEFSVTDNGSGMDSDTLKQAFRPFFTTKSRNQGNGLGLTVVHDLIKQAGGEIALESCLGTGTRVTIRMPRIEISGGIELSRDWDLSKEL